MSGSALSLRWRVDPPVSLVTDGAVDVGTLLTLDRSGLRDRPSLPLNLAIAQVGTPRPSRTRELRKAFERVREGIRPGDRLAFVGASGVIDDLDAWFDKPVPTLAAALEAGARRFATVRDGHAGTRLAVVVNTAVQEPMQPLLTAAGVLSEQAIGVELFCGHSAADLGLLTRLANLGGGETRVSQPGRSLAEAFVERVEDLRDQRALDVQIELTFSPIAQPGQLFRVAPTPVFLRNVRLGDGNRQLIIEVGPVTARGPDPAFLLTAMLPKRRIGRYRLFDARVYTRQAGERPVWSGGAVQRCSADPNEASEVEAEVVAAREQVEITAWSEDVARCYAEGDARRVSSTLDRLVRHFVTLGRKRAVEQVSQMRLRFLRSGALSRADVNRLRRLASNPALG